MGGWKMWAGAAMMVAGGSVMYFGFNEIGGVLLSSGFAMAGVGLGHKIEKAARTISDASKALADAIAAQNPPEAKP